MWTALVIVAAVWIGIVVAISCRAAKYPSTREMVFALLDNAYANGYFVRDNACHGMSPDELAYDLVCHAADCENLRTEFLTPYVREWMRQKGLL